MSILNSFTLIGGVVTTLCVLPTQVANSAPKGPSIWEKSERILLTENPKRATSARSSIVHAIALMKGDIPLDGTVLIRTFPNARGETTVQFFRRRYNESLDRMQNSPLLFAVTYDRVSRRWIVNKKVSRQSRQRARVFDSRGTWPAVSRAVWEDVEQTLTRTEIVVSGIQTSAPYAKDFMVRIGQPSGGPYSYYQLSKKLRIVSLSVSAH